MILILRGLRIIILKKNLRVFKTLFSGYKTELNLLSGEYKRIFIFGKTFFIKPFIYCFIICLGFIISLVKKFSAIIFSIVVFSCLGFAQPAGGPAAGGPGGSPSNGGVPSFGNPSSPGNPSSLGNPPSGSIPPAGNLPPPVPVPPPSPDGNSHGSSGGSSSGSSSSSSVIINYRGERKAASDLPLEVLGTYLIKKNDAVHFTVHFNQAVNPSKITSDSVFFNGKNLGNSVMIKFNRRSDSVTIIWSQTLFSEDEIKDISIHLENVQTFDGKLIEELKVK
jgi:hypothetical protein